MRTTCRGSDQARKFAIIWGALTLGLLTLAACRLGTPSPAPTPSTTPGSPTAEGSRPTPFDTAVPTTAPAPTPTPGGLDHNQALREPFRRDHEEFPEATCYNLKLTVDVDRATVAGYQRIRYTNTKMVTLDTLYLRLFPNAPAYGGTMTVTHLTMDGRAVEPVMELEDSALRVPMESALGPGDQIEVALDFILNLPTDEHPADSQEPAAGYRQLGAYEDTVALANAYPMVAVYDEEWKVELAPAYGDAVFSEVAFFDVSITAPSTMTLAASGTCTSSISAPGQRTWSCVAPLMRDFNAVLGEHYRVKSREVDGITVNSVYYTEGGAGGEEALEYASNALRLFNTRIGAYPYLELDVVETPTLAGGIEYPGLVVINTWYYDDGGAGMEWLVVHEVLHQWWYGLVGNDQVNDPWLDEALTQYCTLLYLEEQYGQDVADDLVESLFRGPYERLREAGGDKPAGLPVAAYTRSEYAPVVYEKGPLYFHALRQRVGVGSFWEILATYFEQNRYRIATPEDWLAAVELVTDDEHRDLYQEWIGAP